MRISKEERQQARIDIRSWGADEKPELVERLLNALDEADSEKAELQQENQRLRDKVAELEAQAPDPDEELINLDRQRRGEE